MCVCVCVCVNRERGDYQKFKVLLAQLCPTLCNHMDYSLLDFSLHGTLQTRILEWIAISFSRGYSQPRD